VEACSFGLSRSIVDAGSGTAGRCIQYGEASSFEWGLLCTAHNLLKLAGATATHPMSTMA
jgi:hypothetical protein